MKKILDKTKILALKDKIEVKIGTDKKKIYLILFACLVFVYLDSSLIMKLQVKGIKSAGPRIIKLKQDLNNLVKDLARMQELKSKQGQKNKQVSLQLKKIIPEDQIAQLLQDISGIANKNEVKILQIKPSPQSAVLAGALGKYSPLLVALDLSCEYHKLGHFIDDLQDGQIFVEVESINIESRPGDYFKQNVNLVLRTYVKK